MKKILYNPFVMLLIGGISGVLSKLLDIYTQNLGEVFSQLSVWILIGVILTIFSDTRKIACLDIFLFCIGMLAAYYITAELTDSVWSMQFVGGWLIFSLFSPLFAYFTWMTKEKGLFPKILSIGIVLVALLSSVILFDGPRIQDGVIGLLLVYFLFFCKVKRG